MARWLTWKKRQKNTVWGTNPKCFVVCSLGSRKTTSLYLLNEILKSIRMLNGILTLIKQRNLVALKYVPS